MRRMTSRAGLSLGAALWIGLAGCQTPRAAQVHHEGIRYGPWWEESAAPEGPIAIGKPVVLPATPIEDPLAPVTGEQEPKAAPR